MMVKRIYDHLKSKNLNPYFIGQHKGECLEKYCVIKENVQTNYSGTNVLGYKLIDIIIFVPINSYIELENYKKEILESIRELKSLRKTGNETPAIVDDTKKAYTISVEYQIMKKLEV